MFGVGELLIPSFQTFHIEIRYGYACPDESTGQDVLALHGIKGSSTNLTLDDSFEDALLTAEVKDDFITVLFTGPHRELWNDPVFRFGPREPFVIGEAAGQQRAPRRPG